MEKTMKILWEKFLNMSRNIIGSLESPSLPFWCVVFTFLASVTLRNFVEFFSNNTWIKSDMLLHFYASYFVLGLTLLLAFHLWTKEKIEKLFKLIFSSFIILIVGPSIDLLITGGKGNHITYLMPEFHGSYVNLIERFFTFFGKFQEFGVSPGLKIEIFLALIGVALYFYIKKLSWLKIILGTISIYAIIFIYSFSPYTMKTVFDGLQISFAYSETLFINFFLLIAFFLLMALGFLENKKFFWSIVKDIRLTRLLHYWLMFVLGFILVMSVKNQPILNEESIFYLPFIFISILFAGIFSIITNNIADVEIDKVCNEDRPLVRSEISLVDYKKIAGSALVMSLVYAAAVNFKVFFLILFCVGNYFIYSMPPLRIKRIPFFSKAVILLNSVALIIVGFNGLNNLNILYFLKFIQDFGANISNFSLLFGLFLFACLLAINFIDIKDYEGDKRGGVKTLSVIFGLKISKILISFGFLAAYLLAGVLIGSQSILWLSIFLGVVQFYLVNKKTYQEGYIFAVYLLSLVGLFLIIFGVLK